MAKKKKKKPPPDSTEPKGKMLPAEGSAAPPDESGTRVDDGARHAFFSFKGELKGLPSDATETDLAGICAALNREPRGVSKPVLRISRLSPTEILISTGEVRGPLDGGGNRVRLRRENDQWILVDCLFWIS